jgi:hypothetical protein
VGYVLHADVGTALGIILGLPVGPALGDAEGVSLGLQLVTMLGDALGSPLGRLMGSILRVALGLPDCAELELRTALGAGLLLGIVQGISVGQKLPG